MDTATRFQNLNKAVCISHKTNTLRKAMHPTTVPQSRWEGQTEFFNFAMENFEFTPIKFCLKINIVPHPVLSRGA